MSHARLFDLYSFWDTARGGNQLPVEADFFDAEASVVQQVNKDAFLLEVRDDGRIYPRILGTNLARFLGLDVAGQLLDSRKLVSAKAELTQLIIEATDACHAFLIDMQYSTKTRTKKLIECLCLPIQGQTGSRFAFGLFEPQKGRLAELEEPFGKVKIIGVSNLSKPEGFTNAKD